MLMKVISLVPENTFNIFHITWKVSLW